MKTAKLTLSLFLIFFSIGRSLSQPPLPPSFSLVSIQQKDTTICQGSSLTLSLLKPVTNLENGLVAYYPFSGNANDVTGNGNDLSVHGPVLATDRFGNANQCYLFDGTPSAAQYLITNNISNFVTNTYTISFWANVQAYNPPHIGGNPYNYDDFKLQAFYSVNSNNWNISPLMAASLDIDNNSRLFVGHAGDTYYKSADSLIQLDQWYFVTVVYDGRLCKIYKDGELLGSFAASISFQNQFDFVIGGIRNGTAMDVMGGFKGKLDEFRYYNRALSDIEIQELYNTSNTNQLTYTWSTGKISEQIQVSPTETTTYYVTVNDGVDSYQDSVKVMVNALPDLLVNSAAICAGSSIALQASGATTYSWSPVTNLDVNESNSVMASPLTTTTYTVTGFDANTGCTATVQSIVTVNSLPEVRVNSEAVCQGSSIALIASGASRYTWAPSAELDKTAGDTVFATPMQTSTYTVMGTDEQTGCSNSAVSTVTVKPLPSVAVNSGSICSGSSITLIASGASSYSWSPSTSLNTITGDTVLATPISTTSFTVTGTDSSTGCANSSISTVTVNPLPVITVNSGSVCKGSSMTLTASGADSYSWSPATSLSATSGNQVKAGPDTTTTYIITGTITNTGCRSTAVSTVSVNPLPIPPVGINGSRCGAGTVTLSATVPAGQTVSWFATSSGGTALATGSNFITPQLSNTTTYFAEANILNTGCASATRTAVTATVYIVAPPVATSKSRCGSGTLELTATPPDGATVAWYSAAKGGTALATTLTYVTPVLKSTTTYYVESQKNNCASATRTAVSATINTIPSAPTAGSSSRCGSGVITISATPPSGSTADWYAASSGGTSLLSGSLTYTVTITGTTTFYAVSRNTTTGCVSSTRTAVTATASGSPAAPSSVSGTLTACPKSGTNYKYTSTTVSGVSGYVWTIPICASGTSTTNSITIKLTGASASDSIFVQSRNSTGCLSVKRGVKITTATGCTACLAPALTGSKNSTYPTSYQEEDQALQVTAHPNPSLSLFRIQLTSVDRITPVRVRVMDITGREIENRSWLVPGTSIELGANYRSGLYIIEAAQGNQRKQLKLVKEGK